MKQSFKMLLLATLFFSGISSLMAQRTITGIVSDAETGEALIGANISVKGAGTGTITDLDGSYSLELPQDQTTLIFSYTGYASQELEVGVSNVLDVAMQSGELLSEVVVIGYGSVEKEDLTGSVQEIGSESFNRGAITGPQELLAGKVAGVSITTDGAPGAGSSIRIRGESSLSASNNPLIVIDGVPLSTDDVNGARNPLNLLNPNDIESFTVLKDASAAAIYGNRASGGVIIITTKTGSQGKKIKVGYNGNVSIGVRGNELDIFDAEGYRALLNDQFKDNPDALEALGNANTNWQDEIYQSAFGQDHNVYASGALKEIPYRVSLGYTSKEGLLKTDMFERLSGSINVNPGFLDNTLQIKTGLKFARTENRFADIGAINNALAFDPTQPIFEEGNAFGGYYAWTDASGNPITVAPTNPIALLEQKEDISTVNRYILNFNADYRMPFLPALRANLNLAYDRSDSEGTVFIPENAAFAFANGGEDKEYTQEKENSLLEFYLNYSETFGKNRVDLLGGYSWQRFFDEAFESSTNIAGTIVLAEPNRDPSELFLVSFFGRLNYEYDDRLLATFTLRRDGTSRFSEENRWGLFPAAALAYKVIDRNYSKGLSSLKARVGFGVTGQENIGDRYAYQAIYQLGQDNARYQFGDRFINTIRPNGYDANIKWEETTTYNAAVDFGFFENRLTGTVEYYLRETADILNFVPVPAGTNLSNFITTNVGDMDTRGLELSLNATAIQKEDMYLNIGFNITYIENEIVRLTATDDPNYQGVLRGDIDGGVGSQIQINSVGFPAKSFFVFEQVFDEGGNPVEGLYVDRNSDGIINNQDQYRLEKPFADYTAGLTTNFQYKDFDLSFAGRANFGNFMYNNIWSDQANFARLRNSTGVLRNVNRAINRVGFQNPEYFSDFFVQDASFFRMDHITIGYNFKEGIGDFLRIYATVQNPFVITDYEGLDPEVFDGIDREVYPRPRTFLFGVNVEF